MIVDITRWRGRNAGLVNHTINNFWFTKTNSIKTTKLLISWKFQWKWKKLVENTLVVSKLQHLDSPCQNGGFWGRWTLWTVRTPHASCKTHQTATMGYDMFMLAIATTMVIAMAMVIMFVNGNAIHVTCLQLRGPRLVWAWGGALR